MGLTRQTIEAMAPDQAALKAASGLLKPALWPMRGQSFTGNLIWGECQGSGVNPYRVMADTQDIGSKCTCPSRKFPCKHAITNTPSVSPRLNLRVGQDSSQAGTSGSSERDQKGTLPTSTAGDFAGANEIYSLEMRRATASKLITEKSFSRDGARTIPA